jgi:hypothetical protein
VIAFIQIVRRLLADLVALAAENALWGEERIANELLLKPGLRVSPRSVRKSPARLRISALLASLKVRIRRPGLPQVREEIMSTRAVRWIVGH